MWTEIETEVELRGFCVKFISCYFCLFSFLPDCGNKWGSQADGRAAESSSAVESLRKVSFRGDLVANSKERVALY